ncbi:sigma factor-like helix-turn-helix DNA-binding protein [Lactobacillus intestinalis]|uniref:sigma factor-like helix-turn-helix DNA-binding protein n=1 Tax=Lactobacillus intestinalis TaxID=151781 RepID=UPI0026E926AB|nr:sigma factor-like helix-turn-helix DNA-binding protein [Lactobacillus intestinalis]
MKNIDQRTTFKNVSKFLKSTINNLLNLTGMHKADLKQPISNDLSNVNKDDPALKEYFYYASVLNCVQKALDNMTEPCKQILIKRYLDDLTSERVALSINLSATSVDRYSSHGAVEFAQRFIYYQQINHVTPLIDLVAYK